jgi:hypothetical protein
MRTTLFASLAIVFTCAFLGLPGTAHARWHRETVRGNGQRVTVTRALTGFDSVGVAVPCDADIRPGDFKVELTIDQNLEGLVKTRLSGKSLEIETEDGKELKMDVACKLVIRLPHLTGIGVAGSGDAVVSGFKESGAIDLAIAGSGNLDYTGESGDLKAAIAGSGDMTLAGSAKHLDGSIAGSGDLDAHRLSAKDGADLSIAGSGNIRAHVEGGEVDASIAGSGDINWTGGARAGGRTVIGSGRIHHDRG